jgi:phosphopantetheinyl transferase
MARAEHWTDQLSPEQLKQLSSDQKQKQEAIQEIVHAERAYVRDLKLISRVLPPPLPLFSSPL